MVKDTNSSIRNKFHKFITCNLFLITNALIAQVGVVQSLDLGHSKREDSEVFNNQMWTELLKELQKSYEIKNSGEPQVKDLLSNLLGRCCLTLRRSNCVLMIELSLCKIGMILIDRQM